MLGKLSHLSGQFVCLGYTNINSEVWGGGWVCGQSRHTVIMGLAIWQGLSWKGPTSLSWATFTAYNGLHHANAETRQTWKLLRWSRFQAGASMFLLEYVLLTGLNWSRVVDFMRIRSHWCYGHYMSAWRSRSGWIEQSRNVIWALSTTLPLGRVRPSTSLCILHPSYIKAPGALSEFNLHFVVCGPVSAFIHLLLSECWRKL